MLKQTHPKRLMNVKTFLVTVVEGLIVTATMELLDMKTFDDIPTNDIIPQDAWLHSEPNRKDMLSSITDKLLDKFVKFRYNGDSDVSENDMVAE